MPGTEVKLGPFIGGINLESDPSSIADNELVDCLNMDVALDGSLMSRPPVVQAGTIGGLTGRLRILGSAVLPSGTYLIGASSNSTYSFNGVAWSLITNTMAAGTVVTYKDKIYIPALPGSANPGGSWDGAVFTAIAAMPKGETAVIWKERMWIGPGTSGTTNTARLSFSGLADPASWNPADFFDIDPGNGQKLVKITIYNNNLLTFKEDATYVLSYDTKPADAQLVIVSPTIGTTSQRCVVNYENSVFTYHEGGVYEIINYNFAKVNVKLPFVLDTSSPASRSINIFLSIVGDRLVCKFYNNIYVYSLRSRSWSRWKCENQFVHNFGQLVAWPIGVPSGEPLTYYAGSCLTTSTEYFRIREKANTTDIEADGIINCSIQTKNYDFGLAYKFKRLFWWGMDGLTVNQVIGTATPVVFNFSVTWGSLNNTIWNDRFTWEFPSSNVSYSVVGNAPAGAGNSRRFFKFPKSLRFRQINFKIDMSTDGTTLQGPARIYSLSPFMTAHETVAKVVN